MAVVATVAAAAWLGTGVLVRRARVAQLPALQTEAVPEAARGQIVAADLEARRAPSSESVGALASAYHASQLPAPAIAAYTVAEALATGDWRWTYLRALLLEERGDATGAVAAFEQVIASEPLHGPSWFRLGELAFKAGRLDEAQAAYTRARDAVAEPPFTPVGMAARQIVPLSAYARLGLARVALERGQPETAARELQPAVDAYPGFGPARGLLREAERARGATPAATRRAFGSPYVPPADPRLDAVVATSRHADLLLKHAGLATRAGDAAWREFLVRQALSAAPQDLNVLMEMSAMLQSRRQLPEALAYLQQHEALAPGDHHALVQQGKVLADLGRFSDAEAGTAPQRRGPRHDGRVQPGHGARSAGALGRGARAL